MLVAVTGLAGSGKSEVARVLVEEFGFERFKFADPLKAGLRGMLRSIGYCEDDVERFVEGDLKESLIPEMGFTSRFIQVDMGTRWGRGLHPDFWERIGGARLDEKPDADRCVDDCRFPNEARCVHSRHGFIVRVDRPGAKPAAYRFGRLGRHLYRLGFKFAAHPSERPDLLPADITIKNTGTVDELRAMARVAVHKLRLKAIKDAHERANPPTPPSRCWCGYEPADHDGGHSG